MTTVGTANYSAAAGRAAEAAGRSMIAVAVAAERAGRPGSQTSELRLSVSAMLTAGALAALNALAVIPGPWQLFAAIGLVAVAGSAGYSSARGKMKAGALAAAGAIGVATEGSGAVRTLPPG